MADAVRDQDHKPEEHAPARSTPQQQAGTGPGLAAVTAIRASGAPAAAKIAGLMKAHPNERDAILAWLHEHRGNAFVQRVVAQASLATQTSEPGEIEGKLPAGVDVKSVTASVVIPGKRTLTGDWKSSVATRAPTTVTVEVSHTGVRVSLSPKLFVDATWPLQNAEIRGAGIGFDTGKAFAEVVDGHGVGSGMISIKDRVIATITGMLDKGIAGTKLAKKGYDPTYDPDLAGTLAELTAGFTKLFEGEDQAEQAQPGKPPPIAAKEMSQISAGATVTSKAGGAFLKDGSGLKIGAGSDLTLTAQGAGNIQGLLDSKNAQGAAEAAQLQSLSLSAGDLEVVAKGKPIVKLHSLTMLPGGAIKIDHMTLLGKAADAKAVESGLSLLIGPIALHGREG